MESTQPKFENWMASHGYDAQRWSPELLASLRDRYRREHPAKIVIDCRSASWPVRVYRQEVQL
jgi:hypothetical protein